MSYVIKFKEKIMFEGKNYHIASHVLDDKGNIKKYTTENRAKAAAKKRFRSYKNLYEYEVVPFQEGK